MYESITKHITALPKELQTNRMEINKNIYNMIYYFNNQPHISLKIMNRIFQGKGLVKKWFAEQK